MKRSLFVLLLFLAGCDWNVVSKPSVLVLAVEGLDFDSVPCLQDTGELQGGFQRFCRDSVRFTHAYTPSVLSQPALASVLTGRYPFEHGVHNNGGDYLTEKIDTVAEYAIRNNYRTSFFSGGPPIFRKSGLGQGFEVFDDNISMSLKRYFRPAPDLVASFLRWQKEEVGAKGSFFSVLFFPDLQFAQIPTTNELGNQRSLTRDSQLKALDEAIETLAQTMTARGLWDKTHVLLLGLNGQNKRIRMQELRGSNLYSDNAQVVLMIKPARKERDQGIEWSIDANVSLVDVGSTLFNLVGASDFSFFDRTLEVTSLTTSLERPVVNWNKDRWILTESAWGEWRQVSGNRYALRKGQWLYIHDEKPKIYNVLTDRNEINPLPLKDPVTRAELNEMQDFLLARGDHPWEGFPAPLVEKLTVGRRWAEEGRLTNDEQLSLEHLVSTRAWDRQAVGWLARNAIAAKRWKLLKGLAAEHIRPLWSYIAARMLDETPPPLEDPCLGLVIKGMTNLGREACRDPLFLAFEEWYHSDGEEEARASADFFRQYFYQKLDEDISRLNFMNGLHWDTLLDIPGEPLRVDLVFLLPEFKKYRLKAENSVARISNLAPEEIF